MLPRRALRDQRICVTTRINTGRIELTKVAVIGAGLSGLVVARSLNSCCDVTVFEKSRGVSGRIATRYAKGFEFDHGAQFFTARSEAFQQFLAPLIEAGAVADWHALFAEFDGSKLGTTRQWDSSFPHFVGSPRMTALGKWLSAGLDVRLQTCVQSLAPQAAGWNLVSNTGDELGHFDWVVVAVPAQQAAELTPEGSATHDIAAITRMHGCFALMLGFDAPLSLPFQAALVRNANISWMSVNSSKPGRDDAFTMVVHSTNAWADKHIDDEADSVKQEMLREIARVTRTDVSNASLIQLQRWRYANIEPQSGPSHILEPDRRLAACGDWLVRGRVEAAFLSGTGLAGELEMLIAD